MRLVCALILRSMNWSVLNSFPSQLKKCVLVAAPHTSNWDFPMMLLYGFKLRLRYSWLGKHTLFNGITGFVLRKIGGIPVDRGKNNDFVRTLSSEFSKLEQCILIIPPEGTRSRSEHWKSGFIHIARQANVPIIFGRLDYQEKYLTFSPQIESSLSDDEIIGFAQMFYKDATALHPSKFGPIRLKSKD
ncbi:1-acyl-sn-glycerol-3-phosphate acyltransferase [Betaproteobacteria bacterium]|nr:1-acyl-sn-glycerol-3-phosphate acyltransferase [Betaproteobacteria bacterium]